jgi:hypothetical protein
MRMLAGVSRATAIAILVVTSVLCVVALGSWFVYGRVQVRDVEDCLAIASQVAVVCGLVATWGWFAAGRRVAAVESFWRLTFGPRPDAEPYRRLWRWGRFFLVAWLVAMASMISLVAVGRLGR